MIDMNLTLQTISTPFNFSIKYTRGVKKSFIYTIIIDFPNLTKIILMYLPLLYMYLSFLQTTHPFTLLYKHMNNEAKFSRF